MHTQVKAKDKRINQLVCVSVKKRPSIWQRDLLTLMHTQVKAKDKRINQLEEAKYRLGTHSQKCLFFFNKCFQSVLNSTG